MSNGPAAPATEAAHITNFIKNAIDADLAKGKYAQRTWGGAPGPADKHLNQPKDGANIRTRFPPEPNGYLHFGHAKSILLNFGLAKEYGGICHLRFDDTNPEKEEQEFVDGIIDAMLWLGCDWNANGKEHLYFASDYFDWMYDFAETLIEHGDAYVDSQSAEEMRANRGTLTEPGKNSPFRDRSVEENLKLFREMRDGKHAEGSHVLRAKIDMASGNINLRDPAIYRIKHAHHHRAGDKWHIYPMYTYAHPIEDALENITHSICTLEFEDQRPFYDWLMNQLVEEFAPERWKSFTDAFLETAVLTSPANTLSSLNLLEPKIGSQTLTLIKSFISDLPNQRGTSPDPEASVKFGWERVLNDFSFDRHDFIVLVDAISTLPGQSGGMLNRSFLALPQQIEFSRLNLTYIITSKRYLKQLVDEKHVEGWDDPRMPTLVGARRRGYTPAGFQLMADRVGVSKQNSWIEFTVLEDCMREVMNESCERRVAVLDPLKLIITNYPEGQSEECFAPNHPLKAELGKRAMPFSRELWIEREDFQEVPAKGYFRLFPGNQVRLKYGFVVKCTGCEKDAAGNITAVHCEYSPDSKSGTPGADNYKTKGVIHWVSAAHAYTCEVRLFDRLFKVPHPGKASGNFLDDLNPNSKQIITAELEPSLKSAKAEDRFQFERHGYFVADRKDSKDGAPVFNRAVTLRDSWGATK